MAEQQTNPSSSTNNSGRPLKYTVEHYRKEGVSEQAFLDWFYSVHIPQGVPLMKKHGVVGYAVVSLPPPFLSTLTEHASLAQPNPHHVAHSRSSTDPMNLAAGARTRNRHRLPSRSRQVPTRLGSEHMRSGAGVLGAGSGVPDGAGAGSGLGREGVQEPGGVGGYVEGDDAYWV